MANLNDWESGGSRGRMPSLTAQAWHGAKDMFTEFFCLVLLGPETAFLIYFRGPAALLSTGIEHKWQWSEQESSERERERETERARARKKESK